MTDQTQIPPKKPPLYRGPDHWYDRLPPDSLPAKGSPEWKAHRRDQLNRWRRENPAPHRRTEAQKKAHREYMRSPTQKAKHNARRKIARDLAKQRKPKEPLL